MNIILNSAIGLFVIAAIFGLVMLVAIFKDKPTPKKVLLIHAVVAGLALLAVVYFVIQHHGAGPTLSLALLIGAALGGTYMAMMDFKKKRMSKWVILAHPVIAIIGVVTLVMYVLHL